MLNSTPTKENNNCPLCNHPTFYEVKKNTRYVYKKCTWCGCQRKYKAEKQQPDEQNYFHIFQPYYGAWVEYGWAKDDWGIGLNKERVDRLSKQGNLIWVSYGKDTEKKYYIKSQVVQRCPVRAIAGSNVKLYVVPKSQLTKQ